MATYTFAEQRVVISFLHLRGRDFFRQLSSDNDSTGETSWTWKQCVLGATVQIRPHIVRWRTEAAPPAHQQVRRQGCTSGRAGYFIGAVNRHCKSSAPYFAFPRSQCVPFSMKIWNCWTFLASGCREYWPTTTRLRTIHQRPRQTPRTREVGPDRFSLLRWYLR